MQEKQHVDDLNIEINSDYFFIQHNTHSYQEAIFDFNQPHISDKEIASLNNLIERLDNKELSNVNEIYDLIRSQELPLVKIIHFFVNEYYFDIPKQYDNHGRITFASVNIKYQKMLQWPLVDILSTVLLLQLSISENSKKKIIFSSDFDIVNLWSTLGAFGSFKRLVKRLVYLNFFTFFKELYSVAFSRLWLHANYLLVTDMFALEFEQLAIEKSHNIEIERIAFLLINKTHKEFDIQNNLKTPSVKDFVKKLRKKRIQLALHPSYNTYTVPNLIEEECLQFEQAFETQVDKVRFHFLHCNYPQSLTLLEDNNIKTDYSFYFTENGGVFRGGTTHKFRMWNFSNDRPFNADIVPLLLMECTFDRYMQLHFDDALELCKRKLLQAFTFGQNICLLWHNTEIYYGQTEQDNYQFKLFKELKQYIITLASIPKH